MILAGDIGGTKTILALFPGEENLALFPGGEKRYDPVRQQTFSSQKYASLEQVVQEFLHGEEGSISRACFGVAGPVVRGRCEATNLPWVVETKQLRQTFGIPSVTLLNDLEAMAHGVPALREEEYEVLNTGDPARGGNVALIAAGTGLGEAVLFWDGSCYRPSASEGGHADFAPRTPLEMALLLFLLRRVKRVSYERVVSGPGLVNIYTFFKESEGVREPEWLAERLAREEGGIVISEVALSGKFDLCVRALELFVSLYGAEAGNLALKVMATGGVYIGGGIAPRILSKLREGSFLKAFTDKGRFSQLMADIPVRVITHVHTALLGAARYARESGKEGREP